MFLSRVDLSLYPIMTQFLFKTVYVPGGFPGGSGSKESVCNAGDLVSIPGSGRFPWRGGKV